MPSGHEAKSLPPDLGFGEFVRRIKVGDQSVNRDVRSIVTKGIAFLLRRRLGKTDVSSEVISVIDCDGAGNPDIRAF